MEDLEFKFHRDEDGFDIGLEARPKREIKLDMEEVAKKFDRLHIKTSVVLVTEMDGARVSIYPSGRIMLFDVDEDEGKEIASRVYEIITGEPKNEEGRRALFVGRFQPFHNGHLKVIKNILEENEEVIIVIGSAQEKDTLENPFSEEERRKMVELALKEAGIKNYRIVSVRDFNDDEKWVRAIQKTADFDVVYTMNPWTKRCFEKFGIPVKAHELYERGVYSGTEIRKRMIRGSEWKHLVPKAVAKFIKSVKGEERIRKQIKK